MGMKVNGTSGLTFPDTTTLASAGQSSVQAWVNFNGTGTVAIRASYNVASITDFGVGDYTVNFTTAMEDADYSAVGAVNQNQTNAILDFSLQNIPTTGSVQVASHVTGSFTRADSEIVCVAIFR